MVCLIFQQDEISHSHVHSTYRESRPRQQGGPIRRQDRKHDTSPYSTSPFLSPPPDTSWRRTNSDSALHQSAMQVKSKSRYIDTIIEKSIFLIKFAYFD